MRSKWIVLGIVLEALGVFLLLGEAVILGGNPFSDHVLLPLRAGDQLLIMNEWENASADCGGNSGDIRSAN